MAGNAFNQELEIIKGELTLDKCIEFKNYIWECPMPYLGGGGSIQKKSDRTFMCGFYWSKYGY